MNVRNKFFWFGITTSFVFCAGAGISCGGTIQLKTTILNNYVHEVFKSIGPNVSAGDFNKKFSAGDIINVTFDVKNGQSYSLDIPYVSSYAEAGDYAPSLCADSTKNAIDISLNMWAQSKNIQTSDLFGCPVTFTMSEKGGYSDVLNITKCSSKLSLDDLYGDDKAYANFRGLTEIGQISTFFKPVVAYRSSTPLHEEGNDLNDRYIYVDSLMRSNKIEEVICLSHNDASYSMHINKLKQMPRNFYICELYDKDSTKTTPHPHCNCIELGNDYFSPSIINEHGEVIQEGGAAKIKKILDTIIKCVNIEENGTPKRFIIHCDEGKGRTGFICTLLEAFASPIKTEYDDDVYLSEQDIVSDFMTSYRNYYNITSIDNVKRYQMFIEGTIYRHLYAICCENPIAELGKINWLDPQFSVHEAFKEKLKTHNLWWYTCRFLRDVIGYKGEEGKKSLLALAKLYANEKPILPTDLFPVSASCDGNK